MGSEEAGIGGATSAVAEVARTGCGLLGSLLLLLLTDGTTDAVMVGALIPEGAGAGDASTGSTPAELRVAVGVGGASGGAARPSSIIVGVWLPDEEPPTATFVSTGCVETTTEDAAAPGACAAWTVGFTSGA